jgi:hypothetical protein
MTNMTLAIPEELNKIMKKHKEIKWSEVARQAMWLQAKKLEIMDNLLGKSEFTEKDAQELGDNIKQGIAKKHDLVK